MKLVDAYYLVKPAIPRRLQLMLRRAAIARKKSFYTNVWPIDDRAATIPHGWSEWPAGKKFALVLTHDVDTAIGQEKCDKLIDLELRLGMRSSFNFVPERYRVSSELRQYLVANGFEVGVHGLRHDGNLFASKEKFV